MKILKISVITIILLSLFFYLGFNSNLFKIKILGLPDKISCAEAEEIKKESQIQGKHFFLLQQNLIKQNLKKRFICIKSIDFSYKFPNKLDLKISERKPAAIVNESFITDEDGFVFAQKEIINVPKLQILGFNIKIGAMFPDDIIKKSLLVFNDLAKAGLTVNEARISPERDLLVYSNMKIVLNLDDDLSSKLASLQLILNQAKIESKVIKNIDLRFDKPVISYER